MKNIFVFALSFFASFGARAADAVDGFMSEHWSQTKPYNNLVPAYLPPNTEDGEYQSKWNGHVTAGCVATAMAQTMHYWNWPARFDKSISFNHHVTLDPKKDEKGNVTYKTEFYAEQQVAAGVPVKYDDTDDCKARLTFIAATLGSLTFDRDGSGGQPGAVAAALAEYYETKPTPDPRNDEKMYYSELRNYLKLGYPVPATITGHAVVLHGWRQDEKGNDLYYMNNGNAGDGDRWIDKNTLKTYVPCFPKKMVMIKPIPKKAKLPLTVEWAFPEVYLKIYPEAFEGFTLNAIPSSNKGTPEVSISLGRDIRSYTLEKLTNGQEYSIEITPKFKTLADDDPTVFIMPTTQSVMTTIDDTASDAPTLSAPKSLGVKPSEGGEIKLTGSKTIASIEITPSLKSYTLDKTTYELSKYLSVEGKDGEFTVKIAPIDFLGKSDNYNVVLTFAGKAQDESVAYAETIVTFSASGEETYPGAGEGGGEEESGSETEEKPDPEPEPEPEPEPQPSEDPKNIVTDGGVADYILISPANFVESWTAYVKARAAAHPELTFAVKNAAEIYSAYGDKGGNPADMIKSYIAQQAANGTKYFVLGGAWSDGETISTSEISFVTGGGKDFSKVAITLDNTIPGYYRSFSGKTLATDYPYALIDGDEKPDVVVSRIPLVRWPDETTGVFPTFAEIIEGYAEKVASVENENFSGRHRYACIGGQAVASVPRTSEFWPREIHRYCDGYLDFSDPKHPDSCPDGEIAARRRFRNYFAMYNPVLGAAVLPMGTSVDDFFDDKLGWEAIVAKSHGLEDSSYGTGVDDVHFRRTNTIIKFGIFAMPCLTGRPDWTGAIVGQTKCLKPSLGVAAICNPSGGEVVGFHNTHDGAGEYNVGKVTRCEDPYSTQYEGYLLAALFEAHLDAGEAWVKAHCDYIDKQGFGTWHLWTMYEAMLYGDPLIKVSSVKEGEKACGPGALPAKVLFK